MSDNKHTGRGMNGKGYYIALILCAAAIGITSYVYYRNADQQEAALQESQVIPVGTFAPEEDVPVLATQPREQQSQASVPQQTPGTVVTNHLQTQAPLSGEEIYGYSMEALSYNTTTRDWRVHNGVDIAAEEGTPVCAAAEGTVYATFQDDAMGHTVVIRHTGGYTTTYSSLAEDLAVSAGETVAMGQTIGSVGSTALVETAMGSHLHFAVTCQNQPMDPAEFLDLGQ